MPYKLLLADDSVTIQRVIELTFADEDIQVSAVGDGKKAIAAIQADRPDIVLADVGMPERDGYEVAAFIKTNTEARAHPGAAADRSVRADRRGPCARGRLRRRARQAVRAADGDQSGEGSARRDAAGRTLVDNPGPARREAGVCGAGCALRRWPRRPRPDRSRTTSIGSMRRLQAWRGLRHRRRSAAPLRCRPLLRTRQLTSTRCRSLGTRRRPHRRHSPRASPTGIRTSAATRGGRRRSTRDRSNWIRRRNYAPDCLRSPRRTRGCGCRAHRPGSRRADQAVACTGAGRACAAHAARRRFPSRPWLRRSRHCCLPSRAVPWRRRRLPAVE